MADKMKGLGGFSRMGKETERMAKPVAAAMDSKASPPKVAGEGDEAGTKTHTIEEKPDGTFESHMNDGTAAEHPDHLHLLAHLGHQLTGGDKHHVMSHDGMTATSHMIHEDGQHEGPEEHNSAEEAKQALDKFFGEEAAEPAHQEGGEEEAEPAYGGMGA